MKIIKKNLLCYNIEKYRRLSEPIKASVWFLICGFMQRGISTLTTPIFTRLLTTNEFGEYNVFMSWIEILTTLITLKLSVGVYMRGLIKYQDKRDEYSSSLLGLTTTLIILFWGIYLLFREFFNKLFGLSTFLMCCMFLMMFTGAAFNFWSVRQRVDFKYKTLVKLTLFISLAKPCIGIIAVLLSTTQKVEARILSIVGIELVAFSGLYISQMKKGKKFFDKKYWIYALGFNIPLIPHYLSQTILNHSDRLMIGKIIGSKEAGIYSLAYSIATIMILVNTSLQNTYNPWVYKKIKEKSFSDIRKISNILLLIVGISNFILVIFAPEAIRIFATEAYYEAIWIIPPISIGVVLMFVYCLFANVEMYFGKTNYMMFASLIGAIVNIILNIIFIPIFGYIAAAYTTSICYMIYAICHYMFMRNICKRKLNMVKIYDVKFIIIIISIYIISCALMMFLYKFNYIRYFIIVICAILIILKRNKIYMLANEIVNLKKDNI